MSVVLDPRGWFDAGLVDFAPPHGSVEQLAEEIASLPQAVRDAIEATAETIVGMIGEYGLSPVLSVDDPGVSLTVAILIALVIRAAVRLASRLPPARAVG